MDPRIGPRMPRIPTTLYRARGVTRGPAISVEMSDEAENRGVLVPFP